MACEDLKAIYDQLEAQVTQLTREIADEPSSERGPDQAALKLLSAKAFAAQQQYTACVAASLPAPTSITVNGSQSTISHLAPQSAEDAALWNRATADQMDVIGNDFRGLEEIGSAPFKRDSAKRYIPTFNFWYPQTRPSDSATHYKRTLAGKPIDVHSSDLSGGAYIDYDLNINIVPNPNYQDLLSNAHPREYTEIMDLEWTLSSQFGTPAGQPNCDDSDSIASFQYLEAEVQVSGNPNDGHQEALSSWLRDRLFRDLCVYGPWIYDAGHCCHAEIHPAEQIWWRDDIPNGKRYTLSAICDGSGRYWWRDQMADTLGLIKLKPWGAPPIDGLFAIAFEVHVPLNTPPPQPLVFEVTNINDYNVVEYPNGDQTYSLMYQGRTLVQFLPHNKAFEVSFEGVGSVSTITQAGFNIRGFLVIRTAVGTLTPKGSSQVSDVNNVPETEERDAFEKVEGHYIFSVAVNSGASSYIGTVVDLNGQWASGGIEGPIITITGNSLFIDMRTTNQPFANGSILSPSEITVTFPGTGTFTGQLQSGGTILWSNGSTWTKTLRVPIATIFDLNGKWAAGGVPGPVITTLGNNFTIDMSALHRPSAIGVIGSQTSISVTFQDDQTYSAVLHLPDIILWSNNSQWTKV